jgi:hypothetical protein
MKLFYLFLASFFFSLGAVAQNSWKVLLNDKTVLSSSAENEEKNKVLIKKADLKKKKDFSLLYTEKNNKKNWQRVIALYDENDQELFQQEGTKLKMPTASLQSYFKKAKKIRIYTWALPTDPKLKAAIRIRRVHLCTLILQ